MDKWLEQCIDIKNVHETDHISLTIKENCLGEYILKLKLSNIKRKIHLPVFYTNLVLSRELAEYMGIPLNTLDVVVYYRPKNVLNYFSISKVIDKSQNRRYNIVDDNNNNISIYKTKPYEEHILGKFVRRFKIYGGII